MHACIGEGNGNPLQDSCLENPRDRGAWWVAVSGVAQSQTQLKWLSSSSIILLDSTYKWYHMIFVFVWLTLLSMIISRSVHITTNGIISFFYGWAILYCIYEHSSPATPFFPCLQSFPASGSFAVSWLFTSGDQSTGASASASVLPVNVQGWFLLWLAGLISLPSKGLSRVFSSTVWKHQFFGAQPSFRSNSHIYTWLLEKP